MVTVLALVPVRVTEHTPPLRAQVFELRVTEPVPVWVQVTFPVGSYPFTLAEHMISFPTSADLGLQVRVIFVIFVVTVKFSVPANGAFLESPL
jgi:hypothetical protein